MSELLSSYQASFPERCRTCPVLLAFLHQAEQAENAADKHTESIEGLIRGQSVTPNSIDNAMITMKGMYLDVSIGLEMTCTNAVAKLVEVAEQCLGDPNSNELHIFPLSINIIDSIRESVICRNPNLDDAVAAFQLR
jgi:hypothetical protein